MSETRVRAPWFSDPSNPKVSPERETDRTGPSHGAHHEEQMRRFWDRPEIVSQYSYEHFLFPGEESAFQSEFPEGMSGCRVLDLGCGNGRVARYIRAMGGDVIGADVSRGLISAARKQLPDIDFWLADAASLPFRSGSFDFATFAFNGLDYLYPKVNRMLAIREAWRVLRPGGKLMFSSHNSAALIFGESRKMVQPEMLRFRAKQILTGNAFKSECYLRDLSHPEVPVYYAWPRRFMADLRGVGFRLRSVHPNTLMMRVFRRFVRTDVFAMYADPWPYYVFEKDGA